MEDDGDLVAGLDTRRTGVGNPSVGQATDVHPVVHRATPTTDFSAKSSTMAVPARSRLYTLSCPETVVAWHPAGSSLSDVEEPPPHRTTGRARASGSHRMTLIIERYQVSSSKK